MLSILLIKIRSLHQIHNKYYQIIDYSNDFLKSYFNNYLEKNDEEQNYLIKNDKEKKYEKNKGKYKRKNNKLEEGFINFD